MSRTEYVTILKPDGGLCVVDASPGELRVPLFGLLKGQKSISGSAVGSNAEEGHAGIFRRARDSATIDLYSTGEINDMIQRLRHNRVRYRAVLVNDSKHRSYK